MKLALALPSEPNSSWELARQVGITHAVTFVGIATNPSRRKPSAAPSAIGSTYNVEPLESPWELKQLVELKNRFNKAGFAVQMIGGGPPQDKIALGLPGRDRQIQNFNCFIENLGICGIPVLVWGWTAKFVWLRTSTTIRARAGSLVSGYNHQQMERGPAANVGGLTEEALWRNLDYFLQRVIPVAEKANVKMALHPADPPLSPIRGMPRIIRSVSACDRALEMYPSKYHGLCFCQGCFAEMEVDIPATIRHFAGKIHCAHFRDVKGTAERFAEVWPDAGPTNMLAALHAYQEVGFDGPIRPDHVPTMFGETNERPGYEISGRLFGIGYMKGLLEVIRIAE